MASPDRTPLFVAFLFAVFALGLLTPIVGIGGGLWVVYLFDLYAPWSAIVPAVVGLAAGVLGGLATLRLDDLRRRRT